MEYSVDKLVTDAFIEGGILKPGERLSPSDLSYGRDVLWRMLDHWSTETLMIPFITHQVFSVDSSKRKYTYGKQGDFVSPRPMEIFEAYWRDGSGGDYPLRVVSLQTYSEGAMYKENSVGRPSMMYYEPSYPNAQVMFSTYPLTSDKLHLKVLLPFDMMTISSVCDCGESNEQAISCDDKCCNDCGFDVDDLEYSVTCPDSCDANCRANVIQQCKNDLEAKGTCYGCQCLPYTNSYNFDTGSNIISCSVTASIKARIKPKPIDFIYNAPVEFPPGYIATLVSNLKVMLSSTYQMGLSNIDIQIAMQLKSKVKNLNARIPELRVDKALQRGSNRHSVNYFPTN